jgi:hypothetical protein
MVDLEMILKAIDELPADELERVKQRVEKRQNVAEKQYALEDVEIWIANLHAAIDAFRADLSDIQMRDIVNDMNIGYVSPKELNVLEQIAAWVEEDQT